MLKDSVISAKIPSLLWEAVSSAMMHSSCGTDDPGKECMRDNEFSKDFSKDTGIT